MSSEHKILDNGNASFATSIGVKTKKTITNTISAMKKKLAHTHSPIFMSAERFLNFSEIQLILLL